MPKFPWAVSSPKGDGRRRQSFGRAAGILCRFPWCWNSPGTTGTGGSNCSQSQGRALYLFIWQLSRVSVWDQRGWRRMRLERASAPLSCAGRKGRERKTAPSSPGLRLIVFHAGGKSSLPGGERAQGALQELPGSPGHGDSTGTHPQPGRVQGKWERLCFLEKTNPFLFYFFFPEMGIKRRTAQTIRFSHAHE